jgi:N-acetylglucosaminyldiphosphoundecaprenol N-acetyl-beta-D-mannosaminyltransferase
MTKNKKKISEKGLKKEGIWGIDFTSTPKDGLLRYMYRRLANFKINQQSEPKIFIVTPNPEQLIISEGDSKFAEILNRADISLPDGHGVVAAFRFMNLPKTASPPLRPFFYLIQGLGVGFSILFDRKWLEKDLKVVRGRDFLIDLIKMADENGWRVFFLGGRNKVAERSKIKLMNDFRKIDLKAETGPILNDQGVPVNQTEEKLEMGVLSKVNKFKPHLLVVGFGAPKQEKWLDRMWGDLGIGAAIVVGGTFDYITGEAKLPPNWISEAGLEWLWRFFSGSQKSKRIVKAYPQFPLKVYWRKITSD